MSGSAIEHKLDVLFSFFFAVGDVDKQKNSSSILFQPTSGRRNGEGLRGDHFQNSVQ